MLKIGINQKNSPDWDAPGCDEDARSTWVDEMAEQFKDEPENIIDAIALALDDPDEPEMKLLIDGVIHRDAVKIGHQILEIVEQHAEEIAERQWEVLNGQ